MDYNINFTKRYHVIVLYNTKKVVIIPADNEELTPIRVTTSRNFISNMGMPHPERYEIRYAHTCDAVNLLRKNGLGCYSRFILKEHFGTITDTTEILAWHNLYHCLEEKYNGNDATKGRKNKKSK